MLNIDMEFHKGILFIRLSDSLVKDTINKFDEEVISFINDNGISNIVYNITNLKEIDCYGINALLSGYDKSKKNKGKSLLCGLNEPIVKHRIKNSRLLNYMYETSDELSAINVINL